MPIVHCLNHDADGATMVEYALLIMLIAMVAFAGVALLICSTLIDYSRRLPV